jgi:hypothetical protein
VTTLAAVVHDAAAEAEAASVSEADLGTVREAAAALDRAPTMVFETVSLPS